MKNTQLNLTKSLEELRSLGVKDILIEVFQQSRGDREQYEYILELKNRLVEVVGFDFFHKDINELLTAYCEEHQWHLVCAHIEHYEVMWAKAIKDFILKNYKLLKNLSNEQ